MPVAIQMPGQRPKRDELDIIMQGLQIAQGYYGMKMDMAKIDAYKNDQATAKLKLKADLGNTEAQTAYHQAQTKKLASASDDHLTQRELAEMELKGFKRVGDGKGGSPYTMTGGRTVNLLAPQKEQKAIEWSTEAKEYTADDGKIRIGSYMTNKSGAAPRWIRSSSDPLAAKQAEVGASGGPKLTETERAAADKAADGLLAVMDMRDAIDKSVNRTKAGKAWDRVSLIKATPFTEARTRYTQAIGRLFSGGAINADENETFLSMAPSPLDDQLIAQTKLNNAYAMLASRLQDRGLKPDEVITSRRELLKNAPQLKTSGQSGTALAAPAENPNVRIIDGITFRRVNGGWQEE